METNQVFKCAKCGNGIFEYKVIAKVAGLWFYCLECEKCGNKSVLECENQEEIAKEQENNKNQHKYQKIT